MRKLVFVVVVCAFVARPVMADPFGHGDGYDGGTANWDRQDGYYAGQGGEFTIWGDDLLLSNSAYADSTSGLTWGSVGGPESFQTFCIETGEYVYEPMRIWVSEEDAMGNGYGSGSHAWEGGTGSGDDLGERTAYLYQQFALGKLTGYVYKTSGPDSVTFDSTTASFTRAETAGVLQRVLWALEDEGGSTWGTEFKGVDLDREDERDLADYWYSSLTVPSGFGVGNVRVLQTYGYSKKWDRYYLKQDQLYLTPVPGAAILGVLGLGVAGVKLRKFA